MDEDMPSETTAATDLLLQTKDLCVDFATSRTVRAVDGVSLEIRQGEIVGLVGETGSGKTVFSLSLLRLIRRPGKICRGSLIWQGRNLLELGEEDMRRLRYDFSRTSGQPQPRPHSRGTDIGRYPVTSEVRPSRRAPRGAPVA